MADVGQMIIYFSLALVTVWITFRYLSVFFTPKKANPLMLVPWICFLVFQTWVEGPKNVNFIWILLINITLQSLIAAISFEGKTAKKIFCVVMLFVIWALLEMFVYQVLIRLPLGNDEFSILGSVISKLFAIFLMISLKVKFHDNDTEHLPKKYFFVLMLLPVFSTLIAHNIFTAEAGVGHGGLSFISFSFLMIMNILVFEIYVQLAKGYENEKEKVIFEQQLDMLMKHNEIQKKANEEIAELRHNYKNQMIVLKNEIENGSKEKAVQMIETILNQSLSSYDNMINSGNDLVDAVLNNKCIYAREQNITIRSKIFIPHELQIEQSDLGIIIGNAMDNAIEATMQCKQQREIEINMGIKKNALVIVIKNPYEQEPKMDEKGHLITAKHEKNKHGFGVQSIRKIVEKYDGDMTTIAKDHVFTFTLMINI